MVANGYGNPTMAAPRPIVVQCHMAVDAGGADGITWETDTGYEINFPRSICHDLDSFARSPWLRGDDFSDSAVNTAWALRVAAHEASHIYFWREGFTVPMEKTTDCRAVMQVYNFTRSLGASKATARRVYRLNAGFALAADYASSCDQGHPFTVKPHAHGVTRLPG